MMNTLPKSTPDIKKSVIFLVGPTAVGKTEVAIGLAKQIDAEIISCDSMQVYRGIDIATSKLDQAKREDVPHHLIDILDPKDEFSAAGFRDEAQKLIKEIQQRGKLPLVVGGTGLYMRALIDGLFPDAGKSIILRHRLYRQEKKHGPEYLYKKLQNVDPLTAGELHANDLRRIIRALEVYEKTGIPMSFLKEKTQGIASQYAIKIFGLTRPRKELYEKINKRVDEMFEKGLLEELERLSKSGMGPTAKKALGYKEVLGYLQKKYSLDEAKRLLKRNTRRYAKRQLSWFRSDKRIVWIEIANAETSDKVARIIADKLNK